MICNQHFFFFAITCRRILFKSLFSDDKRYALSKWRFTNSTENQICAQRITLGSKECFISRYKPAISTLFSLFFLALLISIIDARRYTSFPVDILPLNTFNLLQRWSKKKKRKNEHKRNFQENNKTLFHPLSNWLCTLFQEVTPVFQR